MAAAGVVVVSETACFPFFVEFLPDRLVIGRQVDGPVVSLSGVIVVTRYFDEAFVEAEVVSNGILPSVSIGAIIGEALDDVFVDFVQRQPSPWTASYRHHDQGVVAVAWLPGAVDGCSSAAFVSLCAMSRRQSIIAPIRLRTGTGNARKRLQWLEIVFLILRTSRNSHINRMQQHF